MCVRLLRPLVFGAVVLLCGFWAEAQQPNRKPPSGAIPPYRLKTPVPKALVGSPDRRQAPAKPPAASQPGIKVLTAKPQPATPAFRWDLPRDQRVPPGAPAPGVPQPNPWDFFRLLIPDPEFEEGAPWPEPSRSAGPPPRPAEPTAEQISRLTNDQLQGLLKIAAETMSDGLDQLKTGDGWKRHFELGKLQQEFSNDTRLQPNPTVADGVKRGDLTVAEGIKIGSLIVAGGTKLGDMKVGEGVMLGDVIVAEGGKLGDLTLTEGIKRGHLTVREGVKLGDLTVALGFKHGDLTVAEGFKRGDLTVAEAFKRGDLTVALGFKRGDLTVAEGFKRGDLTVALGHKRGDLTVAFGSKQGDLTSGVGVKRGDLTSVTGSLAAKGPDRDSRERMAKVAGRFDEVAAKPEYTKIAAVRGFQTLRLGLREYTLPPTERQTHVLSGSLPILNSALDRQRTGTSWKAFLKLDELEPLLDSEHEWRPEELGRLAEILGRFERVRGDSQYAAIARAPGSETTYQALKALVGTLEEESVGSLPLPPPP